MNLKINIRIIIVFFAISIFSGCVHNGKGVKQNDKKAVNWYRKAAEQGVADGQVHLGNIYHKGKGVDQNNKEAVKWLRKAAEQGNAHGQNNLGTLYLDGK
jgi:TPR repeat protein